MMVFCNYAKHIKPYNFFMAKLYNLLVYIEDLVSDYIIGPIVLLAIVCASSPSTTNLGDSSASTSDPKQLQA